MLPGMTGLVMLVLAVTPEPRLVDLAVASEGRVVVRLENELRAAGFRVVRRRPDEAPTVGAYGEVLWRGEGPIRARRVSDEPAEAAFEDPGDLGVWAIRVVEWLRADPRALVRPIVPAPSPQEPPGLTFEVTGGPLLRGAPELGVGFGLSAGVAVWLAPRFALQVAVSGPLWTTVARGDASAVVREVAVQLRALLSLSLAERWRLVGGLGLGARNVLAVGLTPREFARTSEQTGLDGSAQVSLRLILSPRLFAELRGEVSATFPLVALQFAGAAVGLVNAPGLGLGLSFGVSW